MKKNKFGKFNQNKSLKLSSEIFDLIQIKNKKLLDPGKPKITFISRLKNKF